MREAGLDEWQALGVSQMWGGVRLRLTTALRGVGEWDGGPIGILGRLMVCDRDTPDGQGTIPLPLCSQEGRVVAHDITRLGSGMKMLSGWSIN